MTSEYTYGRTRRDSIAADGHADALETAIPLPGLPQASSQLAVPITVVDRLLGVLYVESVTDQHFGYDDEDALVALAAQLGLAMHHHQQAEELPDDLPAAEDAGQPALAGPPLVVRHFAANDSVFIDDDYLIKGVAGAILWAMLTDFVERRRTSFTNKGLRVDSRIRLPGVSDNLEARLVLLQRRPGRTGGRHPPCQERTRAFFPERGTALATGFRLIFAAPKSRFSKSSFSTPKELVSGLRPSCQSAVSRLHLINQRREKPWPPSTPKSTCVICSSRCN